MRINWPLFAGTTILFALGIYLQGTITGPYPIRTTAAVSFLFAGIGLCLILNSAGRRE